MVSPVASCALPSTVMRVPFRYAPSAVSGRACQRQLFLSKARRNIALAVHMLHGQRRVRAFRMRAQSSFAGMFFASSFVITLLLPAVPCGPFGKTP